MDTAYQHALDYIYGFLDFEKSGLVDQSLHWDIRRMTELLQRRGNPHLNLKTIHIAGTKGKGSVAAMLAYVLKASGYKTGLYTSPHLNSYNERIRIDNEMIPDAGIVSMVNKLMPDITEVNKVAKYGILTTFEVSTSIAFEYFRENAVEVAVIETGLGGRLDATNVVDPEVSVITSISLDHTKILGETLSEIAAEKAGIIKPRKPVVSSPQPADVVEVLATVCRKNRSRLIKVGDDVTWEYLGQKGERQSVRIKGRLGTYELEIPLLGRHQLENAASAVAALEILTEGGMHINADNMSTGFAQVDWPGRLQVLSRHPLLVADGAHNGESAARLVEALKEYFTFEKAILIIGVSADKDLPGIIKELKSVFERVIATHSLHPRALPTMKLVDELQRLDIRATGAKDVSEAVSLAQSLAGRNDLICVTGSLFVVAGAIEHFRENHR